MDYLRDLVEAMFVLISNNEETWEIPKDSDDKHYDYMKQLHQAFSASYLLAYTRNKPILLLL